MASDVEASQGLNVPEVTRIATEAVREHSTNLQVVGVTLGGDGAYAEVLIDIAGCRKQPCRFSIGVFRDASPEAIYDEIASSLERHVREHDS